MLYLVALLLYAASFVFLERRMRCRKRQIQEERLIAFSLQKTNGFGLEQVGDVTLFINQAIVSMP